MILPPLRRLTRLAIRLLIFFFISTILVVALYRVMPIYVTPLMLIRAVEQRMDGKSATYSHRWVPLENISPHLVQAVVASEDNRFLIHHGFDFSEIKKAIRENRNRTRPRGASTISQQTAKNVFLWPQSSWLRKGLEAYFTVLIELVWGKKRIMEVYLNSIEMGPAIYGAESVARRHFHKPAASLTTRESALIAATLPNPRRFSSTAPSEYTRQRSRAIHRLMGQIGKVELDAQAQ